MMKNYSCLHLNFAFQYSFAKRLFQLNIPRPTNQLSDGFNSDFGSVIEYPSKQRQAKI